MTDKTSPLGIDKSQIDAKSALRDFFAAEIEEFQVAAAFGLMIDFYASSVPGGAVPDDQEGDMLLYAWGTYDWGQGPAFSLGLRRQIIYPNGPDDQDIWQLSLSYDYEPKSAFETLGQGEERCTSTEVAANFKASLLRPLFFRRLGLYRFDQLIWFGRPNRKRLIFAAFQPLEFHRTGQYEAWSQPISL